MTTPWNAAHWRQNTYRRYKPVAPVGEQKTIDWGGGRVDAVHKCCGYHVCECVIAVPPHGHKQGQLYGLNGASTNLGVGMTTALLKRAQEESDRRRFDQTLKKFDATLRAALLDEVLQGKREP